MNEFIFVHLLDPKPEGTDLGLSIPLHITLLHWFKTEHTSGEIFDVAEAALAGSDIVETVSTHSDIFGPEKDTPVMRLKRTDRLLNLHLLLLNSMSKIGSDFDESWVGENNWNPHVTDKQDRKLPAEQPLKIENLNLIEKRQSDKHRIVLGKLVLGR